MTGRRVSGWRIGGLAAAVLVWSAIRGAIEAIVMHQPGPREHRWFNRYHTLGVARMAVGALAVWLGMAVLASGGRPVLVLAAGLSLGAWEAFELAYAWGRFSAVVPPQENVLGTGFYVRGRALVALRIARTAGFVVLSLVGLGGMV